MLRVYQPGTPTLIGTPLTVQASHVQCNQPKPPPTATNVNPRVWRWNDHDATHVNMDCVFDDATRLTALPDGAYESTVTTAECRRKRDGGSASPFLQAAGQSAGCRDESANVYGLGIVIIVDTSQPQLTASQRQLISWGWRIETIDKGRGNARRIFARCVGL